MTVRMDSLLDHAPCGFASVADDGCILAINRTLLDRLGYQREELEGRHVQTMLTVGSRIFYQTHLFPLVRLQGSAREIFFLLRTRDGQEVGVLCNVARREVDGGLVSDFAFMEVHERRKFEEALVQARQAADRATAALAARTQELEQANAELESQTVELEIQQQTLREQAAELEETGDALRRVNEELNARGVELERQRAAADEANRAKSSFLAVMSHELRTPLNAIGGYIQLLEMGIHGPVTDAQREALGRVARSQRHLLRLINEVLNLSRIEAGHVEYAVEPVSLVGVIANVLPMVEPQLAARGLRAEVAIPQGLMARADRDKTQQIILNLLSNALKFTPKGGTLSIEGADSAEGGGVVRLTVRDTGVGIPPDMLGSIFEPFVQVDSTHTRNTEGTGLGLAISRDLARGMKGDLSVESELGVGSSFTLILPKN